MWNDYYCVILIKAHVVTTPLPDENFPSLEINILLDFHCILNWSYCSNFLLTRGRLEHALNTTFDSPMARTTYYIILRVSIAMITWPIPKAYSRNLFQTFSAFLACVVLVGWSAWICVEEISFHYSYFNDSVRLNNFCTESSCCMWNNTKIVQQMATH